jgi:hypothetical protein
MLDKGIMHANPLHLLLIMFLFALDVEINVEAIDDRLAMSKQQNDHIAKLTTKINEHELENEKSKFARSMLYNGRRPGIKDGIGFQQGNNVKLNAPKRLSNFVKGKTPMV